MKLKLKTKFNEAKCKCLDIGHRNQHHVYTIGEHNIEETVEERDLGVLVTETLSPSHHIAKIVRKANQIVGMIRRIYEDRSKNNIVPLYKSLVRPHLEYCVQAWGPYLQQDINNIEGVQRRMTKMMREVEEEEYEQRLKKTKLMSLEMRRLRSDLIEVYKIMHNLEGLEREDFFPLRSAGRRGNRYTINGKLLESYLTMRKQRVKLGQTQSEWRELLKGVPQGSIIGPLLFNIFMNDMYYCINECQLYGYADDNTLSKAANDVESLTRSLESDAASTLSWFENNHVCHSAQVPSNCVGYEKSRNTQFPARKYNNQA